MEPEPLNDHPLALGLINEKLWENSIHNEMRIRTMTAKGQSRNRFVNTPFNQQMVESIQIDRN